MDSSAPFSPAAATPRVREGLRHHLSMAATLALVLTVALGGWFATMQLNQPPAEPRFAALGIQPEDAGNGVCDVESLTVDEAIAITKDPLGSLIPEIENPVAEGYPANWFDRLTITTPNVYWYMSQVYDLEDFGVNLPETFFEEAQSVVNEYLDCLKDGTQGQVWRLTSPITTQSQIVMMLPVLSSEDDARELLPEILADSAIFNTNGRGEIRQLKVNPDQTHTGYHAASSFTGFPGYVISPVIYLDADGNVLIEANLFGYSVEEPDREADGSMNVIYGRSAVDNQWYVIDFFYPFAIPGFN